MIHTDFKGEKISQLGMGTMRLPVINGVDKDIDEEKALEMFDYAYKHGINYFDTAWGYHEGNAEIVVGKALSRYPRESFHLTTKFPGYDHNNFPKVKEIFAKQLEKLQTEYFDFYLFHNVCEYNIENYLNPEFGVKEYLVSEREAGRIKHLGFSDHSGIECFKCFLDAYGDVIEFCQIQLNWLDWDFQEAKEKVRILNEKNIPIIVMEPLRGGTLVEPAGSAEKCFRYLQSIPGIVTILSGMSSMEQMQDNLRIFETNEPMGEDEKEALYEKAKKMTSGVPCTACRYCTTYCPMEINIPYMMNQYNQITFNPEGLSWYTSMAIGGVEKGKKPWDCLSCGACKEVCPQQIDIPGYLAKLSAKLKQA